MLIISVFHSVPGVPREKVERFAGLVTYFQRLFSRANDGLPGGQMLPVIQNGKQLHTDPSAA